MKASEKVKAEALRLQTESPRWVGINDLPWLEVAEQRGGARRWTEWVIHILDVDGEFVGVEIEEPLTENSGDWPKPDEWTFHDMRAVTKTVTEYEVVK